jgi:hypothetical protein
MSWCFRQLSLRKPGESNCYLLSRVNTNAAEEDFLAVTLQTCIREVRGWNLGWATGSPGWDFIWFSSVPQSKFQNNISIKLQSLHSRSCPTIIGQPTCYSTLYHPATAEDVKLTTKNMNSVVSFVIFTAMAANIVVFWMRYCVAS